MNTRQKLIAKAYKNIRNIKGLHNLNDLVTYKFFKSITKQLNIKELRAMNQKIKEQQGIMSKF